LPHNEFTIPIDVITRGGISTSANATWPQILEFLNQGIKVTIFIPSQNRTLLVTKAMAQAAINAFLTEHVGQTEPTPGIEPTPGTEPIPGKRPSPGVEPIPPPYTTYKWHNYQGGYSKFRRMANK